MTKPETVLTEVIDAAKAAHADALEKYGSENVLVRDLKMICEFLAKLTEKAEPVDMVLYCPKCGKQHIDAPEQNGRVLWGDEPIDEQSLTPLTTWTNPPHKSHLCHGCGHIWRPSDASTNGVERTASGKDSDTAPTLTVGDARRHVVCVCPDCAASSREKAVVASCLCCGKIGEPGAWKADDPSIYVCAACKRRATFVVPERYGTEEEGEAYMSGWFESKDDSINQPTDTALLETQDMRQQEVEKLQSWLDEIASGNAYRVGSEIEAILRRAAINAHRKEPGNET